MSTESIHETYLHRCFELAQKGAGYVAPNPMVGAVLVHENRIIGEGYHEKYGQAHAEVNCIASVAAAHKALIAHSTIYVSLEPCAHFGKTPPCADLIIANKIPKAVVACRDPFEEVNGKGIEKLEGAGVEVILGILENEAKELNRRFFTFHQKKRPYIILKWAQTADHKIGSNTQERLLITNEYSNRIVHQWRSEEAGILVGTNTALVDDPSLTNRLANGPSPIRIVVDRHLRLPKTLKVFSGEVPTIVINDSKEEHDDKIHYHKVESSADDLKPLLNSLWKLDIQSILVEGGAELIDQFIKQGYWDEARVLTNQELVVGEGIPAPTLTNYIKTSEEQIISDKIEYYWPAE